MALLRYLGIFAILVGVLIRTTTVGQNLATYLRPPELPAHYARLPHLAGGAEASLEDVTVHSSARFSPAERLAYCEDATHFTAADGRELALLSCDPNRKEWNTVMGPLKDARAGNGAVWVLDPLVATSDGSAGLVKVELEWEALQRGEVQFHPLGVETVRSDGGDDRLFAVNHGEQHSTVEVFSLGGCRKDDSHLAYCAKHLATLSHPSLVAPNSIAPVSPYAFFVTQDHRFTRRTRSLLGPVTNMVETIFGLPLARVDYVEFSLPASPAQPVIHIEPVATSIPFANGVALSAAHDKLVVASTTRRELRFYDLTWSSHDAHDVRHPTAQLTRVVPLPFFVDNVSIIPRAPSSSSSSSSAASSTPSTLTVLAAGHPSYPALLATAHQKDWSFRLPGGFNRWAELFSPPGADKLEPWHVTFRHSEQRGMSWAVAVTDPMPLDEGGAGEGEETGGQEWETVFQSNGRIAEGGFGGSTTAVAGWSEGRAWMVVPGLYEEGVKVVRERA
ncbi:uncharacterized protein JCM10292_005676 [Rhodotorula paludigena]|uniref:uncharacterized protein n=1 Tax=Rhodotorula paludigena TaxID=86838 RepID=UPI00317484F2